MNELIIPLAFYVFAMGFLFLLWRHSMQAADRQEKARQMRRDNVMLRIIFEHKSGSRY